MEPNLFKYIWRHSRGEQLVILAIVVVSQVFYFLSLDLPKTIVNKAIQGEAFDSAEATVPFFAVGFDVPGFLAGLGLPERLQLFDGFAMERVPYLVALSIIFMFLVLLNGGFKLQINTQKGRMGERMLRRLRYELFDRVLRFPPAHLKKVKQAEIATMIKDEVEPLGGFIGDAFVQPAFLGGQALTALVFILAQSLYLGGVTVGVLLLQGVIIPKLRLRVLVLGKERQLTARQLAGRVAECVDGVGEIHAHDTSNYERAEIAGRLGHIFHIRFQIYEWKFAIKFLNNLLAQMTPFFFYLVGGYLAITGRLDIGGLVAVIAAYKDLPGPVKELIDWDQQRQDVQIKYEQVIEQFSPEDMLPAGLQEPLAEAPPLAGPVAFANVSLMDESGAKLLDSVSVTFDVAEHVALLGPEAGGKEGLALLLARLQFPTAGSVSIGGADLATLPEAVTGRRIGYVGPEAYLFTLSVRENLLYGLRHRPVRDAAYDEAGRQRRAHEASEARRAGNIDLDPAADWTDYEAAGAAEPAAIEERLLEALRLVQLEEDVYQYGLRGTIEPERRPELAASIVAARGALRSRLDDPAAAALVEPFDRQRYNKNMSVAENLLFGSPIGPRLGPDRFLDEPYVRATLERAGLTQPLTAMGHKIAETMVELFADLPAGHPFFEQYSFIAADDLPEFRAVLAHAGKSGLDALSAADRARLGALAAPYIEARHRLSLIDADMEERLLAGRRAFAEHLPAELAGAVEFYDEKKYIAPATLQDNILFGRLVYGQAQAVHRIGQHITEVLGELGLRQAVLTAGLDFPAGVAGKRLTAIQRQKVGLARAFLKRPDLLIVNAATAAMDNATQMRIVDNVVAARRGRGLVWVLQRADAARKFDRVLVLREGRIAEQGRVAELDRPGTKFAELAAAE